MRGEVRYLHVRRNKDYSWSGFIVCTPVATQLTMVYLANTVFIVYSYPPEWYYWMTSSPHEDNHLSHSGLNRFVIIFVNCVSNELLPWWWQCPYNFGVIAIGSEDNLPPNKVDVGEDRKKQEQGLQRRTHVLWSHPRRKHVAFNPSHEINTEEFRVKGRPRDTVSR